MNVSLVNIPAPCGRNMGGLHYVRVFLLYNIKKIPRPVKHVIQSEIELFNSADYMDIWFSSGSFTEQMGEDSNGEYFKQQIQIFAPKDAPDIAYAIQQLTGVRCVCLYMDGNGQTKLVGSLESPLTFSSDLDTGDATSDKNGHKLTFKTESVHKAYFYLMFEGSTIPDRKVFSPGFSFGFLRSQLH